ncbi:MAG: FAD-dependent oxidoreductase [Rubrivivax sp.]|nr:MAG: FAD-dependent oxidoreductase [Rubrivivax sp.]
MHRLNIGIAGAGLLGRLAAWTLSRQGHRVSVFDPAPGPQPRHDGQGAAGFTAAGMLSPLAERETCEPDLAERGWRSIARWQAISHELGQRHDPPPHFAAMGSLLVAHGPDLGSARRVLSRLWAPEVATPPARPSGTGNTSAPMAAAHSARHPAVALDAAALAALEPGLHSASGPLHAWLLPGEAHIDTVRTLQCLHDDASEVRWHWGRRVSAIGPGWLETADGAAAADVGDPAPGSPGRAATRHEVDWVLDLRGTGATDQCPVRGVRGEMVWLHAPGTNLRRPVRLLHPRHRVYIVPRPDDVVLVGATEIESEDRSPVSLRSAVELMAAAHSVLPALAEARILKLDSNQPWR